MKLWFHRKVPAVSLTRLKAQISTLAWKFTSPEDFRRALRDLFDLYAGRAYRPGDVVLSERRALAYRTPALILRQLELELARHVRENPNAALSAADALWKDDYLEPRQLAAFLLGQAPVDPPQPVLARLQAWCQPKEDRQALDALFDRGAERLRREQAQVWLGLIQDWLNYQRAAFDSLALQALLPTITDRQFENIPPIYQMIRPLLTTPIAAVQSILLDVLEALARRSATETAYFLRQVVTLDPHPAIQRIVRRALPAFPENVQHGLREAIKM
ncbi:MAG TPA: DNA alkylation repair protein [Levilinea sp.]|nr:DNA alkylation repair protein [Levilinea sp.]